jgi:hypothetical protein
MSRIRHKVGRFGQWLVKESAECRRRDGNGASAAHGHFETGRGERGVVAVHGGTCRETRDIPEVAMSQCLPSRSILGKLDIGGDFQGDESQREDVGWLVDLSVEDFWANVKPITFGINAGCYGPLSGETKVANLEYPLKSDEDVGRLQVEVDETGVMNLLQSLEAVSQ